jgi:hypothetical protein
VFHSFLSHNGAHGGNNNGHGGANHHGEDHSMLNFVVMRLQVELATPENVFVVQDDPLENNSYMYFIAKGDCFINVKDRLKDGVEEIRHRSLLPGDHFGVSFLTLLSLKLGNIIVVWMSKDSKRDSKQLLYNG